MALTFPTTSLKKPSGVTAIPSGFKRPAFGTLYGFDAQGDGNAGLANTSSVQFDGINDYMTVIPSSTIQLYGLSVWFNCPTVIDKNTIKGVVLGPSGSNWFLGIGGNYTGTLTDEIISINTGARYGYCDSSAEIAAGWHNTVAVWSTSSATNGGGDGYDIWLDGVKVGNQANTTYGAANLYTIPTSPGMRFGERHGAYPFAFGSTGQLDEIALFSSALSDADVATIYNSGVPGDLTDLSPAGWWRMGDNDGGSGTTVTDQGSESNNGTLNGATFSTDVPS